MASELIPVNADSVLQSFDSKSKATISNALALATIFGQEFSQTADFSTIEELDLPTATLLNNYIVRHTKTLDSAFIKKIERVVDDSVNLNYREALKAPLAAAYYHKGNVTKALEILAEMATLSHSYTGKFNYIMGLWSLEQGNPELAASYFEYAITYGFKNAKLYYAIALSEIPLHNQALIAWDTVMRGGDPNDIEIASRMKKILNASIQDVAIFTDSEKYQF
jgi:tetratricopeptide (TPR) repeat protein